MAASMGVAGSGLAAGGVKRLQSWGKGAFTGSLSGVAKGLGGVALRNTAGLAANRLAESNALRGYVARRGFGSQLVKGTLDRTAGAKFGLNKSFNDQVKDKTKKEEEMFKFAAGSTIRKQKEGEEDKDYKFYKEVEDAKAKHRQEEYVKNLENPGVLTRAIPSSRIGAAAALQSKTIKNRADAANVESQAKMIKASQIEALRKMIGDQHEVTVDGEKKTVDLSQINEDNVNEKIDLKTLKALRDAHNEKAEQGIVDGDLKKIIEETRKIEDDLSRIKGGRAGERDKLVVQLTNLNSRRNQLEQKIDAHFDKSIQTVVKTGESGVEKQIAALNANLTKK
jgi:hypothetical protein